jgi:protein SCO1/2
MVLTGDGKLSHYFYGVIYPHTDVRLALVEASKNRIGSAVDRLVLYCYHYDPVSGKYTAAVMNLVRAGCLAGMLALGLFLVISFRREARAFRPLPSAGPGH